MPIQQLNFAPGEIIVGKVQGITKFGAFIELAGGAVGLVHISEIADTYVKDVKDFIKEGDEVKVKVLNIAGEKIGLSIKQAMAAPPKRVEPREKEVIRGSRPYPMNRPTNAGKANVVPNKMNSNAVTLDDKIAKFLKESDERMQPLKNKMESKKRNRNY